MREKDYEGFRLVCHPDVIWVQSPGFPGGATRRGVDEVITGVFQGNSSRWENFDVVTEEFLETTTGVVVLGRYTGTHRKSGKALNAIVAHVYEVEKGRITRFRMFADTKTMWDAMS
jgi:ketosteroid isomerase-like protein